MTNTASSTLGRARAALSKLTLGRGIVIITAFALAPLWLSSCASGNGENAATGGAGGTGSGGTGGKGGPPIPCETVAPTSCPEPAPHYSDVRPIFEDICIGCHYGAKDGPWTLDGYEHAANWHDLIRGVMLDCSMPPPDAGIEMTLEERQALLQWLRCGYLE